MNSDALASVMLSLFFFNDTATTEIYTLSLHDALPIFHLVERPAGTRQGSRAGLVPDDDLREQGVGVGADRCALLRSEEHTSELQSPCNLVCRLLLEKNIATLKSSAPCLIA